MANLTYAKVAASVDTVSLPSSRSETSRQSRPDAEGHSRRLQATPQLRTRTRLRPCLVLPLEPLTRLRLRLPRMPHLSRSPQQRTRQRPPPPPKPLTRPRRDTGRATTTSRTRSSKSHISTSPTSTSVLSASTKVRSGGRLVGRAARRAASTCTPMSLRGCTVQVASAGCAGTVTMSRIPSARTMERGSVVWASCRRSFRSDREMRVGIR